MVDDLGQVLNPMIVNGQQHGGVAQGIGQALYEHAVYAPSTVAQVVCRDRCAAKTAAEGARDARDVHGWAVLLAQNGVVIALHYRRTRMSWTTPTLVEICIGLEINGYLPAEF